jgi:hypothetical protein
LDQLVGEPHNLPRIIDHEPHRRSHALEMPTSTASRSAQIADHWLARRGASPVPFESIGSGHAKLPFSSLIGWPVFVF